MENTTFNLLANGRSNVIFSRNCPSTKSFLSNILFLESNNILFIFFIIIIFFVIIFSFIFHFNITFISIIFIFIILSNLNQIFIYIIIFIFFFNFFFNFNFIIIIINILFFSFIIFLFLLFFFNIFKRKPFPCSDFSISSQHINQIIRHKETSLNSIRIRRKIGNPSNLTPHSTFIITIITIIIIIFKEL